MTLRVSIHSIAVVLLLFAASAIAQDQPWRTSQPTSQPRQAAPSGQNRVSNGSQYGQPNRTNPQGQAAMGIVARTPTWWPLQPADEQRVNAVLKAWEQSGNRIQMFTSKFAKRVYKAALAGPNAGRLQLVTTDVGEMKYKKPDKGYFEIIGDPQKQPEQNLGRREKWICDGDSYYQYDFTQKKLIQQIMPPAMRGKALGDGPVPFIFGTKAEKMKERYWIRQVPTPQGKNEIWLEVWPREQQGVADFARAEVHLDANDMHPIGVQLHKTLGRPVRMRNGQIRLIQNGPIESYTFYETEINPNNLVLFFKGNPFKASLPSGWTKDIKPARVMGQNRPAGQNRMGQNPPPPQRR